LILVLAALTALLASAQPQPAVSLSFDHVDRATPARKNLDPGLLWLRIGNSGRTSIQVLAGAAEAGAEGVEVVHEIVSDGKPAPGWISPPAHYSPISEATLVEIKPNSDLLFSVPLNHVGPSWRLSITFERAGRQPEGTVDFTWAGVPTKERSAWKK
jgi:hypothetical protein